MMFEANVQEALASLFPDIPVHLRPNGFYLYLLGGYTLVVTRAQPDERWVLTLQSMEDGTMQHQFFSATDFYICLEHFQKFFQGLSQTLLIEESKAFQEFYTQVCEALGVEPNWTKDGFQSAHVFRKIARLREAGMGHVDGPLAAPVMPSGEPSQDRIDGHAVTLPADALFAYQEQADTGGERPHSLTLVYYEGV